MDRLGNLKAKRNNLLEQKNTILNEKPSKFKMILYFSGIVASLILSSLTFWNTTPSLIFCITYLYTVGVPVFYNRNKQFKVWEIERKISDIQRKIDYIDETDYISKIKLYDDIKKERSLNDVVLSDTYEEYYDDEMVNDGPKLKLKM